MISLEWQSQAVCRNETNLDIFHIEDNESSHPAKMVCAGCPVVGQCQTYSIPRAELGGIWGGLTEVERRWVRAGRRSTQFTARCTGCGKKFVPVRLSAKFCNEPCRNAFYRWRKSSETLVGNRAPNAKLNSA